MNARTRTARHILKTRTRTNHATARAHRTLATGQPQTARTHLLAAGLDDATAHRFAGAFSRGVLADGTRETTVKLKGRTTKRVAVKLYSAQTFAARLAVYRPKDLTAAARFEQAAHRLAA